MTRGEHTPGIVERLRATRKVSSFGGGSISADGAICHSHVNYVREPVNPDGPEAADLISELVGALEKARGYVSNNILHDPKALRLHREIKDAIAKARGGAE